MQSPKTTVVVCMIGWRTDEASDQSSVIRTVKSRCLPLIGPPIISRRQKLEKIAPRLSMSQMRCGCRRDLKWRLVDQDNDHHQLKTDLAHCRQMFICLHRMCDLPQKTDDEDACAADGTASSCNQSTAFSKQTTKPMQVEHLRLLMNQLLEIHTLNTFREWR